LRKYVVLAPNEHLSGCSHRATTDRHLELTELAEGRYSLDGTPADCTRVGLAHLWPQLECVVSGINDGGNLGADVYLSGTVAAAREAALFGKPAIAVSQYRRRGAKADWERSARWTQHVLEVLLEETAVAGRYWNVNLPDLSDLAEHGDPDAIPEIVFCPLDPNPLPVSFLLEDGRLRYHGDYHGRPRRAGSDVDVCFSGRIAVTQLSLSGA
jgi:5'-nucleotidase